MSITLTKNQIWILGRPNFACAGVAKLLIAGELYEDVAKKAEYEQAVYIHWASNLLDKHGDNWWEEGNQILKDLCKQLVEKKEAVSNG